MLSFACPRCGKGLNVKDEYADRRGKCPGCALVFVPAEVHAAERPTQTESPKGRQPAADPDKEVSAVTLGIDLPTAGQATLPPRPDGPGGPLPEEHYDFLAPPQAPDEIGRLGPYRVLKVLGAGGMGVVFQAEDPLLKRKVALKAMLPALAASASARQRFLREAQTAAAIEHDHIVPIFQVGEDRGVPFIAMPFLKGQALDGRLKRDKEVPLAEVLRIGRETALGLAAAHAQGLIHRDIKPANLWLEEGTGRVKILDFGLARAAQDGAQLTQTGAIIGTPAYMAPEQASGKAVDGRCDLFSLGCVLYRLCTGKLPFQGNDTISTLMAVATEDPPPPHAVNPAVPQKLSDLVMRLLAKAPEQRPAAAAQVATLLAALGTGDTANHEATAQVQKKDRAASSETAARPLRKEARTAKQRAAAPAGRPPWLLPVVLGGVAAVVVLAVALVFLLKGSGNGSDAQGGGASSDGTGRDMTHAPGGTGDDKTRPGGPMVPVANLPPNGPRPTAIELLPLIDPAKDAVRGTWQLQGGDLVGQSAVHAPIEVPYQPPDEYDYLVEFTRTSGHGDVALALSRLGHSCQWTMGLNNGDFGFSSVGGKSLRTRRPGLAIVNGRRYATKVEVRKDRLVAYLDGQKVSEVQTDGTDLSMYFGTRLRNESLLGLTIFSASATFHRVAVVEVSGQGKFTRKAAGPDMVNGAGGDNRKAAEWVLKHRGEIIVALPDGAGSQVLSLDKLPPSPFVVRTVYLGAVKPLAANEWGVLAGLSNLETLQLDGAPLGDEGLRKLRDLPKLKTLILSRCGLTDQGLAALKALPNVQDLVLMYNEISDAGLMHCNALPKLTRLNLVSTQVTGPGLATLAGHPRLTELELDRTGGTDAGLELLARGNPGLLTLSLGFTDVTDAGLAHLKGLRKLKQLSLHHTREITDAGLAPLGDLPELSSLVLWATNISDAGLVHLKALPRLTHLNLSETRVSDAGLVHLQAVRTLTEVSLGQTRVTEAGAQKLRAALPGCQVLLR